jgi:hypothetical protein
MEKRTVKTLEGFLTDIALDALLSAADAITGDASGVVALVPRIVTNLIQVERSTVAGEALLARCGAEADLDLIEPMDLVAMDLTRDLVDMVQAIIQAVPSPGADECVDFVSGLYLTWISASAVAKVSDLYSQFLLSAPLSVKEFIELEVPVLGISISKIVSDGVVMLAALGSAVRDLKAGVGCRVHKPEPMFGVDDEFEVIDTGSSTVAGPSKREAEAVQPPRTRRTSLAPSVVLVPDDTGLPAGFDEPVPSVVPIFMESDREERPVAARGSGSGFLGVLILTGVVGAGAVWARSRARKKRGGHRG